MRMLKKWLRKLRQGFKDYRFVVSWQLETGEIIYFKRAVADGVWGVHYIEDARKFRSYSAAREAADLVNARPAFSAHLQSDPMIALKSSKVRARIHSASGSYIGPIMN